MSNPTQPDVLNRMISRLEEANARSYNKPSRTDERSSKADDDDRHQSPNPKATSRQRSSWVRPWLVASIGLLIAALVYLTTFGRESFRVDAAKLIVARWINASVLHTMPQARPQDGAAPVPSIPLEIEQRLHRMVDVLADLQQRMEQLKASQDQVSHSGAEIAAQLKIDREQMLRDNADIADQLKATQDQLKATQAQLAEVVSSEPGASGRKFFRRKRVSALRPSPKVRSSAR
jgi:septal ring factor EnvC (AmiA/AmiB activator)